MRCDKFWLGTRNVISKSLDIDFRHGYFHGLNLEDVFDNKQIQTRNQKPGDKWYLICYFISGHHYLPGVIATLEYCNA